MKPEDIILFDMDGTLCDYEQPFRAAMIKLQSPEERPYDDFKRNEFPDYLKARKKLVQSRVSWWAKLPRFQLGFDIWDWAESLGYRGIVLTQGQKENPKSWMGKKIWIDDNLGVDTAITITRDKGLVYGKVLVDDWQPYIERWLGWRPRGLVIMPAHDHNAKFKHPQVIRYDGDNFGEVATAIMKRMKGE